MSLRANSSRSSSVATTGSRPTNSGIRPYFRRSSGSTSRKISPVLRSSGANTLALKPMEADRPRAEMIFSSPLKAPPHTNRMLVGFILLADDVHAQFDTLVADKHGRTGDELA